MLLDGAPADVARACGMGAWIGRGATGHGLVGCACGVRAPVLAVSAVAARLRLAVAGSRTAAWRMWRCRASVCRCTGLHPAPPRCCRSSARPWRLVRKSREVERPLANVAAGHAARAGGSESRCLGRQATPELAFGHFQHHATHVFMPGHAHKTPSQATGTLRLSSTLTPPSRPILMWCVVRDALYWLVRQYVIVYHCMLTLFRTTWLRFSVRIKWLRSSTVKKKST